MKTQSNAPTQEQERKYPDTVKLEVGKTVIGKMLAFREVTFDGRRQIAVECIVKGVSKDDNDPRTIWWPNPKKFALPPLATPFRIVRKTQGQKGEPALYSVEIAETAAECEALWSGNA